MAIGTMAALALGSLGSAAIGAVASNKASKSASKAASSDRALQAHIYDDTKSRFQPLYEGGMSGFDAYLYNMGLGDKPEGYDGYEETPMARYLLEKGRDTIEGGAAYSGGLYSGETLEALDAERRRVIGADTGQHMDRLFSLAGLGANAASNTGSAGQFYASQSGQSGRFAAGMQGQAAMGMANSIQGGIRDMAGLYGYFNPMQAYAQNMNGAPQTASAPMPRPY